MKENDTSQKFRSTQKINSNKDDKNVSRHKRSLSSHCTLSLKDNCLFLAQNVRRLEVTTSL